MITSILSIIEIIAILFSFLKFKDIQHFYLSSKSVWSFRSKHKELISILFKDKKYGPKDTWTQRKATEYGHLDLLKLKIKDNGINYACNIIDPAARYGHVEVVKYLYTKGLKCIQQRIDMAAKKGHIEVVKYLYTKGLTCSQKGIDWAAEDGHLEMVKYLESRGLKSGQNFSNQRIEMWSNWN